ncbi:sugar ABC transporter substrate-binding protein [Pseudobutyrivibrio xylanivorans]|uniref:Sugar ABC transporter substrate-binding protein n=1 Tax=Pseudobutyrivibrio xylanivorans TaxID=185007 RepID=A0A5P6VPI3_PSEXY|nr:extracellular solute-binding protein [Pseudobutyrivibrio xylanivorans]QFJ54477.1 sugar ABC transporter substrate-binding protein [Pseudobutyrivibrio xylanivorans]
MRRKLAMMLICAISVSAFSGCGKSEATEDKGDATATENTIFSGELEENVTIQVLENDTAISKGYFQQLIDAFNKEYEQYGITAVDANMDQYLDLANDGPYGYGPDVLYQANDVIMQYAQGKHILPLPVEKLECYSQVPKSAWQAYQVDIDGQTYTCGVPVNVQCPMLYYRRDLLPEDWKDNWDKDSNDVPDMVENWNDMYAFSVDRHNENGDTYGYMKSLYDVYFSSGFLFSYGGYIFGDNNTNPEDIGFSAGDSAKGAWVLSQLASTMNEDCIDDTITTNAYSKLADGTYFATMSTPDTYTTFFDELVNEYEADGLSEEEARAKAEENLVMTGIPKLPESGDLKEENPKLIDSKAMGGVNGYAISSYTKSPNACLAFVDFATKYDMIMLRNETLGISPAREDVSNEIGGLSESIYEKLEKGNIVLMPSIKEVAQIWTPGQTFFTDIAKDAFRSDSEKKYKDIDSMRAGLEEMCQQIHDAIFTLE